MCYDFSHYTQWIACDDYGERLEINDIGKLNLVVHINIYVQFTVKSYTLWSDSLGPIHCTYCNSGTSK